MTGSNRSASAAVLAAVVTMSLVVGAAENPALKLKASVIGTGTPSSMTIELFRWSTDVERAPLLAALAPPKPAPPSAPAAPAAGRAGRAARGGRGAAAPPLSPTARLTNAVKAAPTVGFIWGDGPTGYSIKYAWRSPSPGAKDRVVLVTDRRLVAGEPSEAEFTVVEMHLDGKGVGEAKSSLTAPVVVDTTANTLALDKYTDAPVLLKVTR